MTEHVLTRRELNRALLARQLLLRRERLPVAEALERVAGLQAQDRVAPFVGLWTRLDGFEGAMLRDELTAREAVKATLMRGTLHIVTARDYRLILPAVEPMVRELYRSYLRDREDVAGLDQLTAKALAYAATPRTNAEMNALLGDDGWWRVRREGRFVSAPGDDRWAFGRPARFIAAEAWLDGPLATRDAALEHLARRYLAAFGPAGVDDLAAWSRLPVRDLRPVVERLELRRFRDERGRVLLDLPDAPLSDESTPAPVRLLPAFDNAILSHADRTRVVADEARRRVIRAGIVDPTILVDGFVAGRWRLQRTGKIELEPFANALPRGAREEADRLATWLSESA